MPAARPSSSKSKASNPHSTSKTSKSSSPRSNRAKRFTCCAWWCDSAFVRRTDMLKHVGSEHFGKRAYCTICGVVMKQGSNMGTHLNTHFKNYCTLCSCGQGFTDPGACTRHREATGHEKGITHRKVRPTITPPVKVQHLAGLGLNLEIISDSSFIPPLFDESYHLKGMPKRRAQEKYNPNDYVISEPQGDPAIPSSQATVFLSTDGAPAAEYQEPIPLEFPALAEIQVDKLDVNFSYDVEIVKQPQNGQAMITNVYTECHGSVLDPTGYSQPPSDDHYPPPEANHSYNPHHTASPHIDPNIDSYPPVGTNYFPVPPRPFGEPHVQQEHTEVFYPSQALDPYPVLMAAPSLDMPPHHGFFKEMGFDAPVPGEVQDFCYPYAHFNHTY